MLSILTEDPRVIYQFWIEVPASTEAAGKYNAKPMIKVCEEFAQSIGILCESSHVRIIDGRMPVRIQFYICAPQNVILHKVTALFAFAQVHELYFANQFFLSK
jgi:hypothetical protein